MTGNEEWERFKRTSAILPRRTPVVQAGPAAAPPPVKKAKPQRSVVPFRGKDEPATARLTLATATPVDDPGLLRRLQRSQVRLEARLDLHGLTETEAYDAVRAFLEQAVRRRWRVLLIITGRGLVLRTSVPRWLSDDIRVRFAHPAAQAHGGNGALYVVLRTKAG